MSRAALKQDPITELELRTIEIQRQRVAHLKAELENAEASLSQLEDFCLQRLRDGHPIKGGLIATTEWVQLPCRPPWKEEFLVHMEQSHKFHRSFVEATVRSRWPSKTRELLIIGPRPRLIPVKTWKKK